MLYSVSLANLKTKVESIKKSSSMSKSNPNSTFVFSPVFQSLSCDWDINSEKSEQSKVKGKRKSDMVRLVFNTIFYNLEDIQKGLY